MRPTKVGRTAGNSFVCLLELVCKVILNDKYFPALGLVKIHHDCSRVSPNFMVSVILFKIQLNAYFRKLVDTEKASNEMKSCSQTSLIEHSDSIIHFIYTGVRSILGNINKASKKKKVNTRKLVLVDTDRSVICRHGYNDFRGPSPETLRSRGSFKTLICRRRCTSSCNLAALKRTVQCRPCYLSSLPHFVFVNI